MRVVLLFDLGSPPPENQDYSSYEKDSAWDQEIDLKRALQRLGHEVILVGLFDDITRLVRELNEIKPDVVFNTAESFKNNRDFEPQIAGVLELLGIPYTGTRSLGLGICKDKALAKKILAQHRIKIPRWVTSKKSRPIRSLKNFHFPAFIKAVNTEGSEGISKDSLAEDENSAIERVRYLHEKFGSDVIIEEFIDGRELYVSVLGDKKLKVFPVREITFKHFPEDEPKFATYKVKWDEKYRKKWGIRNKFAEDLSGDTAQRIEKIVKKAFQVLHLRAYARFDLRLTENQELYLLEANPNPSITSYDDFAASAKKAGLEYDELVQKLLDMT